VSRFAYRKQNRRLPGFTLIELAVALAIVAIIIGGIVALGRYMVVGTREQSDQVLARLQVQYVSFWIGEDVVQAGNISLGNYTTDSGYKVVGFPFVLECVDKDKVNYTVTYGVQDMKDNLGRDLLSLYRYSTKNSGNVTVAQYLDPLSTRCQRGQLGNGTLLNVLKLDVTAMVNQKESSGTYEISPRKGNVTWVGG